MVVGTHALIQEAVSFADLGLVVIDEQHRFGVDQRGALEAKAGGRSPHVLLMTATPIPRTLGQVLYADLDVSDLRTPPAGRVKIRTGIRARPISTARGARSARRRPLGHRTFVVVPLIEEGVDDGDGAVAAESEAVRLAALLDPLRVGMVHGRLKPAERDAEMTRFRDGELDVLVGTTVVEVGVDVPAATMMVIEGADRFGLAQLHQLRGRVGRGTVESFCVLVTDSTDEIAMARLRAVVESNDGFELAEKDFELRKRGRRARSRPERLPAAPGRVAPGRRAPRAGGPGARARRGAARRRRPDGAAAAGASPPSSRTAGCGASRPANRRAARDGPATPAGSSPGPRAGSGSRRPGPGTRPLGDRVKQTLFAILEPDLRGRQRPGPVRRLAARPASRRCRAAPRTRPSSSSDKGAAAVIATNLGRDPPGRAARADRPGRGARPGWPAREAAAAGPFDVVIVDPPYDGPVAARRGRSRRVGPPARAAAAGSSPSTSGATRRRPSIGLLASERERRFGETTLTFYRRQEDR